PPIEQVPAWRRQRREPWRQRVGRFRSLPDFDTSRRAAALGIAPYGSFRPLARMSFNHSRAMGTDTSLYTSLEARGLPPRRFRFVSTNASSPKLPPLYSGSHRGRPRPPTMRSG